MKDMKEGGEADVIKGVHCHHGVVAIKTWSRFSDIKIKKVELLIEVRTLITGITHPVQNAYHQNIIQLLGILINESSRCIGYIMPYMPLGSLEDIIHDKSHQYDEKQIKSWILQICYGLSYLHSKKIIHRDIKPSNILLGKCYDDVKLSDFGISRSLENITHTLTKGSGTVFYMAPEMFKGEDYDFSLDIYSLSITIWEILYRRIPFDHVKAKSLFELQMKISDGIRPELDDDLSEAVLDFFVRCWHIDASKRPAIDYIRKFCSNTSLLCTDLGSSVSECTTSFENLNVHNNNEGFSKTITSKKFLQPITFKSTDVYNKITVMPINALNGDESSSPVLPKKSNESFPILKPIEQSSEKQTILLLGGCDKSWNRVDSLLLLENNGQNWKKLNIKLPYAVKYHGAQFLSNNLYTFGGYNKKNKQLNCTYKLSKSLQWERMADMNQKRRGISNTSVILNNQIWVLGGWDKGALKSVEMYDPETNEWKYMKQMNESRSSAAAAVVNGKVFCCGGEDEKKWLSSVECYDSSSDVWTLICNLPRPIDGHGAVEMNGNFIVIGGWHYPNCFNNVWELDTTDENNVWFEKPSMSMPRRWFSIANVDGKIFICGGEDGFAKSTDDVEIFDGGMVQG